MRTLFIISMVELKIIILKEVQVVRWKGQGLQILIGLFYLGVMGINLLLNLEIQTLYMHNHNKVIYTELTELMEKLHLLNRKMKLEKHMRDLIGMLQF